MKTCPELYGVTESPARFGVTPSIRVNAVMLAAIKFSHSPWQYAAAGGMFSGAQSCELWDVYPNLIDEDADHEQKVDAKGKQQEYFGSCEVAARK
jgi:hypothetical protein